MQPIRETESYLRVQHFLNLLLFSALLCKCDVYYDVHKCPPMNSMLRHTIPVLILGFSCLETHFNIIQCSRCPN